MKRKASGKQREYERKYEPRRKARLEEKKAELFAEGALLNASNLVRGGFFG